MYIYLCVCVFLDFEFVIYLTSKMNSAFSAIKIIDLC